MKTQEFGTPKVDFSWFLEEDSYTKEHYKHTLADEQGKKELLDAILLCISQGYEIRLGTDGMCLILEANEADDEYTDASYQYVDDSHFVGELTKNGSYPDYYPEAVDYAVEKIEKEVNSIDFDKLTKKQIKERLSNIFKSRKQND